MSAADWSDPQPDEVAPGVHRLPLPLPGDALRAINVYAIQHEDRVTLIDGGWALQDARDQLDKSLRTIGSELAAVTDILVTHAHRDHYTLAVVLRREFGCRISLGAGERAAVEALGQRGLSESEGFLRVLVAAGAMDAAKAVRASGRTFDPSIWEPADVWLRDGAQLDTAGRALQVVHTPGHTAGHVVFADDANGLLFAGDHVLSTITPSLGFEESPSPSPLREFLTSLALLQQRPDALLLPGHGPVRQSVHERIEELVAHHDVRLQDTLDAVGAGAATALDAAQRLRWTRRGRSYAELDRFNQMMAIIETHAHLVVLAERGQVRAQAAADGVISYDLSL